jgi:hypothetical protein
LEKGENSYGGIGGDTPLHLMQTGASTQNPGAGVNEWYGVYNHSIEGDSFDPSLTLRYNSCAFTDTQ